MRNQWLADHPEHNLDTTLRMRDLGVSAFKGANLEPETGDLGKFIWLAQHDKKRVPTGCILLLERLDRFSRDDALKAVNVLTGLILAGVTVVTLDPERVADLKTGGKMEILLPMVMDLIIANEYSSNLSVRVSKGWAKKREKVMAGECKLTAQCPRWLRLVGKKFEPIPERVKVLRTIYRLSEQGIGANQITKRLNKQGVPAWGSSPLWQGSYIAFLLRTRKVLGEHRYVEGRGHDSESPILNYYPAVIPVPQFERVQKGLSDRYFQRGRTGPTQANLFTRLVYDARDKSPITICAKYPGVRQMVSSAATRGSPASLYLGFRYSFFENAFLDFLSEVDPADLAPETLDVQKIDDNLAEARTELARIETAIKTVQQNIVDGGDCAALADMLRQLDVKRQQAASRVDALHRQRHQSPAEKMLGDGKTLIGMIREAQDDDLVTLRTRLKATIKHLVSKIWLRTLDADIDSMEWRIAVAEVQFISGKTRNLFVLYHRWAKWRAKTVRHFAVTTTPVLALMADVHHDTDERLAKVAAGLMRLANRIEAEKKPLKEILREAVASQIATPTKHRKK